MENGHILAFRGISSEALYHFVPFHFVSYTISLHNLFHWTSQGEGEFDNRLIKKDFKLNELSFYLSTLQHIENKRNHQQYMSLQARMTCKKESSTAD